MKIYGQNTNRYATDSSSYDLLDPKIWTKLIAVNRLIFLLYKTHLGVFLGDLGNPSRLGRSWETSWEIRSDFREEKIGRHIWSQHSKSEWEIDGLLVYPFSLPPIYLLLLFCHKILLLLFYHVWLNTHSGGDGS
jgi:hypothetical protein